MSKKRIQIIITSFLILILIFVWANSIKVLKKGLKPKDSSLTTAPSVSTLNSDLIDSKEETYARKEWNEDEDLEWVRCPFCGRQYGVEEEEEEVVEVVDLAVSGIIWDDVRPQVIINGEILGEGDSIEGFLIEKIERQKVILSNKKRKIELAL